MTHCCGFGCAVYTLCLGAHYALVSFLFQIHLFVNLIHFYSSSYRHNKKKLNRSQQWSYTSFLTRSGHSISIVRVFILHVLHCIVYCIWNVRAFQAVPCAHRSYSGSMRCETFALCANRFHHNIFVLHHTTISCGHCFCCYSLPVPPFKHTIHAHAAHRNLSTTWSLISIVKVHTHQNQTTNSHIIVLCTICVC